MKHKIEFEVILKATYEISLEEINEHEGSIVEEFEEQEEIARSIARDKLLDGHGYRDWEMVGFRLE